jgi:anti-sigma factor RsiW
VTCRQFRELLVYLAFGDLEPELRARAEAHLPSCPTCAAEWRGYQEVVRLARLLPDGPLPPVLEQHLRGLLEAVRPTAPEADEL